MKYGATMYGDIIDDRQKGMDELIPHARSIGSWIVLDLLANRSDWIVRVADEEYGVRSVGADGF